jgi:hypothetical protein
MNWNYDADYVWLEGVYYTIPPENFYPREDEQ